MKKGKSPAFQLYASDFYMDTADWEPEEVGIYFRLLMYEWVNKSIPKDKKRLARIAGLSPKKFTKNFKIISPKFIEKDEENLMNEKMEEIREIQDNYKKSLSKSGKLGAKKRWKKDREANGDPNDNPNSESMRLQSSSSSSISPNGDTLKSTRDEILQEGSERKILEEMEKLVEEVYQSETFPKVNAFKNKMLKKGKSPQAIAHALIQWNRKPNKDPKQAWAYCLKIVEVESGNYNERNFSKSEEIHT